MATNQRHRASLVRKKKPRKIKHLNSILEKNRKARHLPVEQSNPRQYKQKKEL